MHSRFTESTLRESLVARGRWFAWHPCCTERPFYAELSHYRIGHGVVGCMVGT